MARYSTWDIGAGAAFVGGFVMLLCSLHYMQELSYSIGVYTGISRALSLYNINANSSLVAALSQSTSLVVALNLTYALIPFALIVLAISTLWLFTRSYARFTAEVLIIVSIIYLMIVAILGYSFKFSSPITFAAALVGGILAAGSSVLLIYRLSNKQPASKRAVSPITINPDLPYSNIKIISNRLMAKLSGELKILDMHFDTIALENLMQMLDRRFDRYSGIKVLAKNDRLGGTFVKSYKDFRTELQNKNIEFELRVLNEKDASKQHERFILDSSTAYKIPPLNIINKKSEHIVSIRHDEVERSFDALWAEATRFDNLRAEPKEVQ